MLQSTFQRNKYFPEKNPTDAFDKKKIYFHTRSVIYIYIDIKPLHIVTFY